MLEGPKSARGAYGVEEGERAAPPPHREEEREARGEARGAVGGRGGREGEEAGRGILRGRRDTAAPRGVKVVSFEDHIDKFH